MYDAKVDVIVVDKLFLMGSHYKSCFGGTNER